MHDVPDELASAVRRAATTAPSHGGDLDTVRRRWRSRRRRRTAMTAGSMAFLVALTAAGVPWLTDRVPPGDTGTATGGERSAPAQPLMLRGPGDQDGISRDEIGEINLDGSITYHPTPTNWAQFVGLPDGRIVGIRRSDAAPDGLPPGAEPTASLVVLGRDDSVELDRGIPLGDGDLSLLGATGRDAFLLRKTGIVGHDLATGRERLLVRPGTGDLDLAEAVRGEVGAELLAVPDRSGPGCAVRVFGLTDGRLRAKLHAGQGCATNVRLSPDGRLLAAHYRPVADQAPERIVILDVATDQVRAEQLLADNRPPEAEYLVGTVKMAWLDTSTVRVARWASTTPGPPAPSLEDLVEVVSVTAQ